jgi:hypothetical protein
VHVTDPDVMRADAEARRSLEDLESSHTSQESASVLLGWLERRSEERE